MDIRAEALTPEDIALLPQTVRGLAHIAGMEVAIACVNAFGGTEIAIPKGGYDARFNAKGKAALQRLEAVCGEEAARAICVEYGGEKLNIPRCHALRVEMRARAIRRAFDDGASVADLVKQHGITYRAIENILNRAT